MADSTKKKVVQAGSSPVKTPVRQTRALVKPTVAPVAPTTAVSPKQARVANPQPVVNPSASVPPVDPKKKVDYSYAGRRSLFQMLKETMGPSMVPTKRLPKIFGGIFVLVILIGAAQFPWFGMLGGNTRISANFGVPLTFLELKLFTLSPEENPIRPGNLIIDLFIYLFVAYLVDVVINMVLNIKFLRTEEEKKGIPELWKDVK